MTQTEPSVTKQTTVPAHVADDGKIILGAGFRQPSQPAHVADSGKIRVGAGCRLPVRR